MFNATLVSDVGNVELYILPHFRERTFTGEQGISNTHWCMSPMAWTSACSLSGSTTVAVVRLHPVFMMHLLLLPGWRLTMQHQLNCWLERFSVIIPRTLACFVWRHPIALEMITAWVRKYMLLSNRHVKVLCSNFGEMTIFSWLSPIIFRARVMLIFPG